MTNPTDIFKALADETRFKIIELLLQDEYCVKALALRLGVTEAAISQHIKILRNAGILRGEKRGYYAHYRVEPQVFYRLLDQLSGIIERIQSADRNKDSTKD